MFLYDWTCLRSIIQKSIRKASIRKTSHCLLSCNGLLHYPYSPFEDLGNSRGLNLPILQQLWNSMGRAIIYNYLSIIIPWDTSRGMPFLCINVYIPYWKFRSMLFLCIMYTILNSRGKRFVKYIKMPWIQGGNIKPWHLQGALSIIIWKFKGWDVSKLFGCENSMGVRKLPGIPSPLPNYLEFQPPLQNNRFPKKTEIVSVY